MKTYALLGLGSFLMHHQPVTSLTGLRLRITQELNLKFNNAEYFVKSIRKKNRTLLKLKLGVIQTRRLNLEEVPQG